MFAACFSVHAQKHETSFYFNGFLPVGEFNSRYDLNPVEFRPMDRYSVAQYAGAGIGLSYRFGFWFDIGYGQLQPYAEASFFWNPTKKSVTDIYDDNDMNDQLGFTPVTPHYFNVPAMLGLKYRYSVTTTVQPFAEFALGFDAMFISRNGYGENNLLWYCYKPSFNFAWMVGAGTYLGDKVSVGLYYFGLGDHRINYNRFCEVSDPTSSKVVKRNIGELAIRFGFHF